MLRFAAAAALAILCALPSAPSFADSCAKITAQRVNVRSAPNGRCLGSLTHGTKFKLTTASCDWCRFAGQTRYIKRQFSLHGHIVRSFGPATRCGKQPSLKRCVG